MAGGIALFKRVIVVAVVFLLLLTGSAFAYEGNESTSDRLSLFIVPQLDGTIVALDAFSGKPLWSFSTGGPLLQSSEPSVSALEVSLFNIIQREGFQDISAEAKNILGATPFMSPDGTIYLSHKTSKLFGLDPLSGTVVSSNIKKSDGTQLLTEEQPICMPSLQVVRTEHTLESHNFSSTSSLTMAHLRVFLRDCSGEELVAGKATSSALPALSATPMGDLQAYDKNGSLLWFYALPSTPSSMVYALTSKSLHIVHPQLPPRLSSNPPHSLTNYKGTPFEGPFSVPERSKTLALPAPPDRDPSRRSVWFWITTICVCTAASIWGLVLLRHQSGKASPEPPLPVSHPPSSLHRSDSTLRLRAEHEELQKQLRQLQEQHIPQPPLPSRPSTADGLSRYRTDFEEKERLGEGGFGTVFRAINKLDGVEYAVKKVVLTNPKENDRVLREVRHLAQLDHPNIIRYYQSWVEEDEWEGSTNFDEENSEITLAADGSKTEGKEEAREGDQGEKSEDSTSDGGESIDYEGDESKLGGTTSCGSSDNSRMRPSKKEIRSGLGRDFSDLDQMERGRKERGGKKGEDDLNITFESADSWAGWEDSKKGGKEENGKRREKEDDLEISFGYISQKSSMGGSWDSPPKKGWEDSKKGWEESRANKKGSQLDITFGGDDANRPVLDGAGMDVTFERMYGSTSESFCDAKGAKGKARKVVVPTRRTILYIQMQYCHQGTLQQWLARPDRVVCIKEAVAIFRQAVKGVAHIHHNHLIHRDLKPANILISAGNNIKICDFGLSTGGAADGGAPLTPMRMLARSHTTGVGSPFYCSPEQLSGERYDSKVDIFSLGIILYEMVHIFSTQMERVTHITELRDGKINDQTKEQYPEISELALRLVQFNPDLRPPATDILSHPLLSNSL